MPISKNIIKNTIKKTFKQKSIASSCSEVHPVKIKAKQKEKKLLFKKDGKKRKKKGKIINDNLIQISLMMQAERLRKFCLIIKIIIIRMCK